MLAVHQWWAWVMIVSNGLAGLWALAADREERLRVPALWWCTGAAQATIVVQVLLGAWMVTAGDRTAPQMHDFYGYVAIIAAAIVFSYRSQLEHRVFLLYGGGGLFLMGLGLRAWQLS